FAQTLFFSFCVFLLIIRLPPLSSLFPYTTLFRSGFLRDEPHGGFFDRRACGHSELHVDAASSDLGELTSQDEICEQRTEERDNQDRKSTRLNSSHRTISYAVFCLKKKKNKLWHKL